jgi:hypothetical protein
MQLKFKKYMNSELPRLEREISDEEWEQLKQEAAHYSRIIIEKCNGASRSINHILLNLGAELDPFFFKIKKLSEYESAVNTLNNIKRYLKLLEDFPEFAEKELQPGGGYFPELMSQIAGVVEFIDAHDNCRMVQK